MTYVKTSNCTSCDWFSFSVRSSIHDQWLSHSSEMSAQEYTYDQAGRLSFVADTPAAEGCTTRAYAYDADSNRKVLRVRPPLEDGSCDNYYPGQLRTYDYGAGDTLNASADAATESYYVRDGLGRYTTLPAADFGGTEVTVTYFHNDLVQSLTQGGASRKWTLDPARRFRTWADGVDPRAVRTNHYAGDSDAPAWIGEDAAGSTWTRNVAGIGGALVAVADQDGAVTLQLSN